MKINTSSCSENINYCQLKYTSLNNSRALARVTNTLSDYDRGRFVLLSANVLTALHAFQLMQGTLTHQLENRRGVSFSLFSAKTHLRDATWNRKLIQKSQLVSLLYLYECSFKQRSLNFQLFAVYSVL